MQETVATIIGNTLLKLSFFNVAFMPFPPSDNLSRQRCSPHTKFKTECLPSSV